MTVERGKYCPKCGARYDAAATYCSKDGVRLELVGAPLDPLIGKRLLDQFRIDARIGEGGMGAVYRARQLSADRYVAIKVLHPEVARSPDAVRRFEREAKISGRLDHPNVVRVFLSGQLPDGNLYLVMELLEGLSLAEQLRVEPVLPLVRTLRILVQVAEGVGAAHEQGVVHRDVKPENVFLVPKGRDQEAVKVLDFGIARRYGPDEAESLTVAGLVLGTALYISPEAAAGGAVDARSDVYSLGVLAYRMLAGVTPFDAPSAAALLVKHLHQPPPPLVAPRGAPPIPPPVADVVMRALAKAPLDRFEDANAFAEALRDAAAVVGLDLGRPRTASVSLAPRPPRVERPAVPVAPSVPEAPEDDDSRLPSAVILAGAFVVGALLVLFVMLWPRGSSGPSVAEVRAESLKGAETALATHDFDGPDGVRATTDVLLAANPADPDALRIRRAAATELVTEGDRERAAGHPDVARARYDEALALLVDGSDIESRIAAASEPPPRARVESIEVAPVPVSGEPVLFTATLGEDDAVPTDVPQFVVLREGRRVGEPIEAARVAAEGTYSASYRFETPGVYTVEFRAGRGADAYAFRTVVEVGQGPRPAPRPRPPGGGGGGPGPVTTQGSWIPLQLSPFERRR